MRTADGFGRNEKKSMVTALCLASLVLAAPTVRAEKVVVIPLGSKTYVGASIFWTGAWRGEENFQYAIGDGMQFDGSSYICVKDHESSLALIPSDDPDHWSLMAVKGGTGDAGEQGVQGATGAKGDTGEQGVQGATGVKGDQGDSGTPGVKGDKGDQGDPGPAGTSSWTDGTGKVTATVDVGIGAGAATPGAKLDVDGEIKMHSTTDTCDAAGAGKIRWSGSDFEGCNGTKWVSFTSEVPTVTSGTGQVWMDRNLGARQVATSLTDTAAYGDLYQWGRLTDGHEKRSHHDPTPQTTTTLSPTDVPGHDEFIAVPGGGGPNWDWRDGQNNNMWQGLDGINNPCPTGFRLPTETEWQAEIDQYGATGSALFDSPLKLVVGGYRSYSDGILNKPGIPGLLLEQYGRRFRRPLLALR